MNWVIHFLSGMILSAVMALCSKKLNKKEIIRINLYFLLANLADIDHLLASPIYDAARCSINFHVLHSWFMFPLYAAGLFFKKTRYLCIGLFLHMGIDFADCLLP
jgi:hypothetical protein